MGRAAGAKAYLKSQLRFYGVPNPGVRAAVADYLRGQSLQNATDVVGVCRALYATNEHELWSAAIAILVECGVTSALLHGGTSTGSKRSPNVDARRSQPRASSASASSVSNWVVTIIVSHDGRCPGGSQAPRA